MRSLLILNEIIVVLFGLCWGSFLNVVAYRCLYGQPFLKQRSYCPLCKATLAWYDTIPVLSWFLLRGKCRSCRKPISWLYPFIEVITAFVVWCIFFRLPVNEFALIEFDFFNQPFLGVLQSLPIELIKYQIALGVFFSALIVAVRTDLEAMVIPQLFSIWLVPIWIICAVFGIIPLSWQLSVTGACVGYGVLWLVAKIFWYATGRDGMGVGDMELLAMIGSFAGPSGAWISLMIGSIVGTLLAGIYLLVTGKEKATRIPFGPFLVFGALLYVLYGSCFLDVMFFI